MKFLLFPTIFLLSALTSSLNSYAHHTFIIGITGGNASGKTTLSRYLLEALREESVTKLGIEPKTIDLLSQDSYFNPELQPESNYVNGKMNFDHPSAMDFPLMLQQLDELKRGGLVNIPNYDFQVSRRTETTQTLGPLEVLIFEGIHVLRDPEILKLIDYKVFVDYPPDLRLARRILRDQKERGNPSEETITFYIDFIRPMHVEFVEPTRHLSDMIYISRNQNELLLGEIVRRFLKKQN